MNSLIGKTGFAQVMKCVGDFVLVKAVTCNGLLLRTEIKKMGVGTVSADEHLTNLERFQSSEVVEIEEKSNISDFGDEELESVVENPEPEDKCMEPFKLFLNWVGIFIFYFQ